MKGKKEPVNRKLLMWLFILTGVISLFLWWRGKAIHESGPVTNTSGDMRFVIEPTRSSPGLSPSLGLRNTKKIIGEIEKLTATASGTYAVYVYHLEDKDSYGVNETLEMPGASIMKLPVIMTVMKMIESGNLKLDDKYTLEEADRAAGSGPLQYKKAGESYNLDELLGYLGKNSDNTAWVMFNRRLGKNAIQDTIDSEGLVNTDYKNLTTTGVDTARMWKFFYSGKIGEENRRKIWGYLTNSIYEDRIPAGLADTEATIVGHKVGTDIDIWADTGIVSCKLSVARCKAKPFVMVIMNREVKRSEAVEIVPGMAKLIWEFENS